MSPSVCTNFDSSSTWLLITSKSVLDVFLTRSLVSHLNPSSPVIINTVNPGYCVSSLLRELEKNWFMAFFSWLGYKALARTTEQGSRTLVHAGLGGDLKRKLPGTDGGVDDRGEEVHGRYLANCEVNEESDFSLSEEGRQAEKKIWVSRPGVF